MSENITDFDAVKGIVAGLLALAGAVPIEEARKIAGLPPLTEQQRKDMEAHLRWNKNTGVVMPLAWAALFPKR